MEMHVDGEMGQRKCNADATGGVVVTSRPVRGRVRGKAGLGREKVSWEAKHRVWA